MRTNLNFFCVKQVNFRKGDTGMMLSDIPQNNTTIIVVCNSCQLVDVTHHTGKECSACGNTLPEPLILPSLEDTPRAISTIALLKRTADKLNDRMEKVGIMSFRDHPTTAEVLHGPTLCGWCNSKYQHRPQTPNCPSCGGLLPKSPGSYPGSLPPATPRRLPRQFLWTVLLNKSKELWLGIILLAVSVAFPIFLPLAVVLTYSGFTMPLRRRKALIKGTETLGVISKVASYKFNKPPAEHQTPQGEFSIMYTVYFRFKANGELLESQQYTYDPTAGNYMIGEPIWVVYCPELLKANSLWPPLA